MKKHFNIDEVIDIICEPDGDYHDSLDADIRVSPKYRDHMAVFELTTTSPRHSTDKFRVTVERIGDDRHHEGKQLMSNNDPILLGFKQVQEALRAIGITDLREIAEVNFRPGKVRISRFVRDADGAMIFVAGDYMTKDLVIPVADSTNTDQVAEDNSDMRREIVLRELNQGALAGMTSEVSEQAADLVLAALDRYDDWKGAQGRSSDERAKLRAGLTVRPTDTRGDTE